MIQERIFRFGDLSRPYRLIAAFALAQLLAAALLIPLRSVAMPSVTLLTAGGLTIGTAALIVAELLLAAGLTYVVYAAVFVRRAARFGLLCVYTFLVSVPIVVIRPFWVAFAMLACIGATWIVVMRAARSMRPRALTLGELHFRAEIFGVLFALTLVPQLLCFFAWGGARAAAALLSSELSALSIFVVPALLIAGADVAEMSYASTNHFVVPFLARRHLAIGAAALVALLELWLFAPHLRSHVPVAVGAEALLFAAGVAVVVWLLRSRTRSSTHASSAGVMKMAAIAAVAFYGVTLLQISIAVVWQMRAPIYVGDDFTMRYPAVRWLSSTATQHTGTREVTVHSFATLDGSRFDVVQGANRDPIPPPAGKRVRAAGTAQHGRGMLRFYEIASPSGFAAHRADFQLMRNSVRFERGAQSPYILAMEAYGVPIGLLAVLGLVLLARRSRSTAIIFALLVAYIWTFAHPSFFMWFFGLPEAMAPAIDMNEVIVFTAGGALVFCALALLVPKRFSDSAISTLLGVVVSLGLLGGLYALYGAAIVSGEKFGIVQALVIFTALGWDAVMSGELFTNGHSHAVPRPARVCLFFGYIVLVAAVVLFGASMHVSNATVVSGFFDSEVYPQRGMMLLGVPIVLVGALFPSRSHDAQQLD